MDYKEEQIEGLTDFDTVKDYLDYIDEVAKTVYMNAPSESWVNALELGKLKTVMAYTVTDQGNEAMIEALSKLLEASMAIATERGIRYHEIVSAVMRKNF